MEEELHVEAKYGRSRKDKMLEGLEQGSKEKFELDWGRVASACKTGISI